VLTAVVTHLGPASYGVRLVGATGGLVQADEGESSLEIDEEGPSPIAPELDELLWSLGAFIVFFLAMRYYIFPRLKKGMEARYGKIQGDRDSAERMTADAAREVSEYREAQAGLRAEAAERVAAARETLDAERADRLAEVNARIATRRGEAATQAEEARSAARESVEAAVATVATRAAELTLGRPPAADTVREVVADVMSAGVAR